MTERGLGLISACWNGGNRMNALGFLKIKKKPLKSLVRQFSKPVPGTTPTNKHGKKVHLIITPVWGSLLVLLC